MWGSTLPRLSADAMAQHRLPTNAEGWFFSQQAAFDAFPEPTQSVVVVAWDRTACGKRCMGCLQTTLRRVRAWSRRRWGSGLGTSC